MYSINMNAYVHEGVLISFEDKHLLLVILMFQ